MKPIPAPPSRESGPSEPPPAAASELLKPAPGSYSNANRRSSASGTPRAYAWLLAASTAVAIAMGWLYITKPVIVTEVAGDPAPMTGGGRGSVTTGPGLLPDREKLPGSEATGPGKPAVISSPEMPASAPTHSQFEETNMRVQHILTATSDDGHVSRIDLEVPVLYQSRHLRWTPAEVARASDLLVRLMDYQDKSRMLRSEGQQLLADWNGLIERSIPTAKLRADSPSMPANQERAAANPGPTDTTTRDAVEIQPGQNP